MKVLHFIHAAEGLAPGGLGERWQAAHEQVLAGDEAHLRLLRGCVLHRHTPGAERALRHFGGRDTHAYQAVSAMYYDSEDDALDHFPAYKRSLREHFSKTDGYYDASRSFVLYSREVTIFQRP
ncbi:EthD domain-containing protein [Streptomyces sp. NPDC048291]|uniref:EthD domain-containing protein n=1 Tax=Streptomyces sp. NPDC048291 TaxID=3365530 RepID=UPI00371CA7EA